MQRVLTIVALVMAIVFAVPAIRHWREQPPAPPPAPQPLRSSWLPPEGLDLGGGGDYSFGLALARDGRRLVLPAAKSGVVSLWLHDLRNGETRTLPGTEGAAMPFWSPDGSRVGFFANGRLRALDLDSGQTSDLAEAASARGAAWNSKGELIFAAQSNGVLMRRDASGSITPLTTLEGDTSHAWPAFIDDTHFVFLATASAPNQSGIWIASLDDPTQRRKLFDADAQAVAVDDALLYVRDLALMAQPIDMKTLDVAGRATAVGLNAGRGPLGQIFATASSDVLIYGAPGSTLRQLQWVSRDGTAIGSPSEPIDAWDLRIAPDGRRVSVTELDPQLRTLDVFIRTSTRPAPLRLSLSTDADESGVWSPDGLRIAWAAQRRKVLLRGAGAVLAEQTIATFDTPVQVWDWSRDSRLLLIGRRTADTGDDLWIQPPAEGATAQAYTTAPFNQTFGAFSPDGHRIAYASDESGHFDIYIDSYPKPGNRVRLTTGGGTEPRWSGDGRELFFRRGAGIHAIVLDGSEVRSTQKLFDAGTAIRAYDVSRDGRFLLNLPADNHMPTSATIVSHWNK
jgi:Tol biopolymer transport system component